MALYDREFDDKIVISFKPQILGTFTATVINLGQENSPTVKNGAMIAYALGFLVFYDDVPNQFGNAMNVMIALGGIVYMIGIGIIIFCAVKALRREKQYSL